MIAYVKQQDIPTVSIRKMKEIDRMMMEEIGVSLLLMMENAGVALTQLSRHLLNGELLNKKLVIFVGKGNNGGGGLAAARHLLNKGCHLTVISAQAEEDFKYAAKSQLETLMNSGFKPIYLDSIDLDELFELIIGSDLIIDSLLGYGVEGNPKEPYSDLIEFINRSHSMILANDLPSGLDADTGLPGIPCIHANATLTLALPKKGLLAPGAEKYVGDLYVADLSIPQAVYNQLELEVPIFFDKSSIAKIITKN